MVIGEQKDLFTANLMATDVNWIAFDTLQEPIRCKANTRYRQKEEWATVSPLPDGKVSVRFDMPLRAITPGQSVVFYDGDYVLGGGKIL